MFSLFKKKEEQVAAQRVFLFNTLTRTKEVFIPLSSKEVLIYSCGPTVYGKQHLGNMRSALFSDTLVRTLEIAGFATKRVINITDVGHMVGDGDAGEDKMSVGAKREQLTPDQVAKKYAQLYFDDLTYLGVDVEKITFAYATDYMNEQIAMIQTLKDKGYTYMLSDGLYFDTEKFPQYGVLGDVQKIRLINGARIKPDAGKKNLHDFVLWRRAKAFDLQKWDSPWGPGNPGWHIECSAMIEKLLGPTIDIHTGGEDHIMVHHNNEIAQSQCAHDRPLAKFFMHNAFLTNGGEKISKSLANESYVSDLIENNIHPLAFRLFSLQAHYRAPLSFILSSVEASNEALYRLWRKCLEIKDVSKEKSETSHAQKVFTTHLFDDLATAQALAVLFTEIDSEHLSMKQKWGLIELAERAFGLSLTNPPLTHSVGIDDLKEPAYEIAKRREEARAVKDFILSDELRDQLDACGYTVEDKPSGTLYTKK
jgi:cysteinyl-tRNA synthetase